MRSSHWRHHDTTTTFPITGRTAMLLETAEGCVARSEIRSRAMEYLSMRKNATAHQTVAQGFDKETVAAEMVAFFNAVGPGERHGV